MNIDNITLNLVRGLIIFSMIFLFLFPILSLIIINNYYYLCFYIIIIPIEIFLLNQFKNNFC
jgi:hypothetical protein